MKKLTQYEFIDACIKKHGKKYDYSLVKYINVSTKIKIICQKHGIFEQIAKNHKDGQKCPRCYGNINLSKSEFINLCKRSDYDYNLLPDKVKVKSIIKVVNKNTKLVYFQWACHHMNGINPIQIESISLTNKFKEIHSNKFDYIIEKDFYYTRDKIKIINKLTNDIVDYRVDRHLKGMAPNKITLNYFLIKSVEKHVNKYDYSLIKEIRGNNFKVDIICKIHGLFKQRVSNHINMGDGCPKCVGKGRWNNEILKEEFFKIHFDKYDYSKVDFQGVDNKIEIICKDHGSFLQNIHKHLKGQGCPECNYTSKGEEYVKRHLEEIGIKYIRQHGFETCRYKNKLNFDFYLPEYNTCIEFDGIQHFKPVKEFGGSKEFLNIVNRDNCKNLWCENNKVNLIRIRYDEIDKIKKILNEKLLLVV